MLHETARSKNKRKSEPFRATEVSCANLNMQQTGSTMRLLISVAIIAATFAGGCFHHHQATTTEALATPPLK
jgi:hypothetical protein